MSENTRAALRSPRLNPFAFPSDTDLRFILLLVCVLGACLWIYGNIPLWQTQKEFLAPEIALFHCRANAQCQAPLALQMVIRMLSGMMLLVSVAVVMYLVFPAWKRWRKRLVPLPIEDVPDVMAELTSLSREAELAQQPQFLWNPLNPVSEGLAFGRMGRYFVALTGGLVTQFYTDLPAFRAIIRHELAHLRNADIDKTYFSVAIWWAFLATSLAPFVAYLLGSFSLEEAAFYFNVSVRVLALALLVLLTRNAVLRTREVYADVRASTWDSPMGALQRVLEHLPRPKWGRWWNMTQRHPDPEKRWIALRDTWPLFQIGFWVAFGTGIAAAISFEGVTNFFLLLAESQQSSFPSSVAAGLILGILAAGVVGSGMWRATFAALAQGRMPPGVGRVALGMTLGVFVGQMLSLSLVGTPLPASNTLGSFLAFWTIWCLLLLLSLLLVLRWIVATATTWLEVTTSKSTLRWSSRLALIVAGEAWAVYFGFLSFVGTLVVPTRFSDISSRLELVWSRLELVWVGLTLLVQPLILVGLISFWVFPLAAWFWRKRVITPAEVGWAWLDPIPQQLTLARRQPFQLRLALLVGIVGGLLFCGVMLWLRFSAPETVRQTDTFKLNLAYWLFSRAAVIQGGIAIVTAAWARRSGVPLALFAAFIAGCVMTIGILSVSLLLGRGIDLDFTWIILSSIVIPGGLLAVLLAPLTALLTKRIGPALRAALVGALIYCGLIFCMTISWRFITGKPITSELTRIMPLIVVQVLVGALVAGRSAQRGWLYGLFAAGITGFVGVSIGDPLTTFNAVISFAQSFTIILVGAFIAITGMLFALPVIIVSLAVRWIRRSRLRKNAGTPTTTKAHSR